MAQKRLERYISHPPCVDSNLTAGDPGLTHRRIGGQVVGIQRFVQSACVDRVCLTSQMCLGETPFERSQELIRLAARSVRQRSSVGVLVRALGGGDRRQGRLLPAVALSPQLGSVHSWASGMRCR